MQEDVDNDILNEKSWFQMKARITTINKNITDQTGLAKINIISRTDFLPTFNVSGNLYTNSTLNSS